MAVGHWVGTLSEPLSYGLCLMVINNDIVCTGFKYMVHEFIVEPIVDNSIYASIESAVKDENSIFEDFDPYHFGSKFVGSLTLSEVARHFFGESILVSTISGVTGSYLADSAYHHFASNHTPSEIWL